VVVASSPVNLDRLTVRLIDGCTSAADVTIPQAELTNQFGTVLILAARVVCSPCTRGACGSTPWHPCRLNHRSRFRGATYVVAATRPCPERRSRSRSSADISDALRTSEPARAARVDSAVRPGSRIAVVFRAMLRTRRSAAV